MAPLSVSVQISVTESAVYRFAGVTGDFSRMHVDAEFARDGVAGHRIAHGVMLIALAERARDAWVERCGEPRPTAGYDRIRFVKPILFDDELVVEYTGDPARPEEPRLVEVRNQRGETVGVATHLVKAAS